MGGLPLGSAIVCGRVVTTWSAARLASYFGAVPSDEVDLDAQDTARYNVAPTSWLFAIRDDLDGVRRLDRLRWGLIPRWARDTSGASKMINARAENLGDRPSYRPLLARHRCVVPIDGFYEWGPEHRPRYVHGRVAQPLEIAGLWTTWRDPQGRDVRSCTLLTAEAFDALTPVHHRMPVALSRQDRDAWLAHEPLHPDEITEIVERGRREAATTWQWHEVSRAVNKVGIDGPELIEPVAPEPQQTQLFGD